MSKKPEFTAAEQAKIDEAVKKQLDAAHAAEIEAEIRNRLLDEQRKQPGYTGY